MTRRYFQAANRTFGPAAVVVAALALAPAAGAQGDEPLPPGNSGTGQYVEPVPDAGGDRPANPGSDGGRRGSLPPGTRADLPGGDEGRILERIATDPGSGAPTGRTARGGEGSGGGDGSRGSGGGGGGDPARPARLGAEEKSALGAVAGALVDSDRPWLGLAVLAGVALTLAAAVAAVRRRRA